VARIHGLEDHLPTTLPAVGERVGRLSRTQRLRRRAEDTLRDLGFDQVVSWSFTSPREAARLRIPAEDLRAKPVRIANPLSEDQSEMRTTLLGSLLDSGARNAARGAERLALFELGSVYLDEPPPGEGGPLAGQFPGEQPAPVREPLRIGAIALGPLEPRSWRTAGQPADFFALKGIAEALAGQLRAPLSFAPGEQPFLHPGRTAAVTVGDQPAGWLGEVHPLVCRAWDLPAAVAFELDAAPLFAASEVGEEEYADVTTFPPALRDLAVVVPTEMPAERVRATVLEAGGELLRTARVFDLYEGEQLGEGRKSLALGLELGAADRTLTDEEVDQVRDAIVAALAEIGGQLRE